MSKEFKKVKGSVLYSDVQCINKLHNLIGPYRPPPPPYNLRMFLQTDFAQLCNVEGAINLCDLSGPYINNSRMDKMDKRAFFNFT